MKHYIAIIHKDADSDYGVSFPDFPGCVTAGTSLEDAKDMAKEALELHMHGMLEDGDDIPEPQCLDAIMDDPDFADGFGFIVDIAPPSKTVRINITANSHDIELIDTYAKKENLSRSQFLVDSAITRIKQGAELT